MPIQSQYRFIENYENVIFHISLVKTLNKASGITVLRIIMSKKLDFQKWLK